VYTLKLNTIVPDKLSFFSYSYYLCSKQKCSEQLLEQWIKSRDVHPCYTVSRRAISRCQSPRWWWSRGVKSSVFSRFDWKSLKSGKAMISKKLGGLRDDKADEADEW